MRTNPFFSTSFRISLVFAALLIGAFVVAGVATNAVTRSSALAESRTRIEIEANAIIHEARTEGLPAAIAAVQARVTGPGGLVYRIVDAKGGTLAGDPSSPNDIVGWHRRNGFGNLTGDHLVFATPLPGAGGNLIIADDLDRAERVRDQIVQTLAIIGAATVSLCLIAGWFATRSALSRLELLFAAAKRVSEGDLSVRVPHNQRSRDDIEEFIGAFNGMLDRVSVLVANIRRVSTDVAHDLRTPLGHLSQKLERLRQAGTMESAKAGVEEAQRDLGQVLQTFEAILRLAEIEAGALRARFEVVDLGAIVDRVADAYRPDIEASGRMLSVATSPHTLVLGDADLLAQVVANLLENTMRHTSPGAHVKVSAVVIARRANLIVQDDGQGIPEDMRSRVLEPFVRVDSSRSRPGAGLGLSIVAAIAKLHGAELTLADGGPGLQVLVQMPAEGG